MSMRPLRNNEDLIFENDGQRQFIGSDKNTRAQIQVDMNYIQIEIPKLHGSSAKKMPGTPSEK